MKFERRAASHGPLDRFGQNPSSINFTQSNRQIDKLIFTPFNGDILFKQKTGSSK